MRRSTVDNFAKPTWLATLTLLASYALAASLVIALLAGLEGRLSAQTSSKTKKSTPAKEAAGSDANTNGPKLPAGFKPPQATPKAMSIEKELIDPKLQNFRRSRDGFIKWQKAIKNPNPSDAEKKLIAEGAKWAVYRLTLKTNRHMLPKLREELLRYVKYFSKGKSKLHLLQEITNRCEDLFDGNAVVRLNAVVLLTQLNTTETPIGKKIPPASPFVPAHVPLLKIVNDPDQLNMVKVPAVVGLTRILIDGPEEDVPRRDIATAFNNELKRAGLHPWYQARLAKGLGAARESFSDPAQQNPAFVNTLVLMMGDPKRDWLVRAEAAKAVGRLPLDGNINIDVVLFQIVKLCKEMAEAYNKKPGEFYWKNGFMKLYFAFNPFDAQYKFGRNSLVDRKKGGQSAITAAYEQVLPLARHVYKGNPRAPQPIPAGVVDGIGQWIDSNRPDNFRVAPNLDPITQQGSESQPTTQPASAG